MPYTIYMDPKVTLEQRKQYAYKELGVTEKNIEGLEGMLAPLRTKHPVTHEHYEHSVRVALVAMEIARFVHQDANALFYAGLLHDLGKIFTPISTLGKQKGWTADDSKIMEAHCMDAFRMIVDRFLYSAHVIVRHHRFQGHRYPAELPPLPDFFGDETQVSIAFSARLLALADVYDAMHRVNDQTGGVALTGEEIRVRMIEQNIDQAHLVSALYHAGILATEIWDHAN
jgi:putative nucleotidyltransferase with HDIG domain